MRAKECARAVRFKADDRGSLSPPANNGHNDDGAMLTPDFGGQTQSGGIHAGDVVGRAFLIGFEV